jgi:NADH dehydrogenase [ubiquinone] 1 alpha subcomplex assembly factor 7
VLAEGADGAVVSLHDYMARANAAYYGGRDPLGADGDFVTAPEISQMFGELIGLWAADLALRASAPDFAWIELGPGRGTLSADALRAMARAGLTPPVHFVETSPVLRDRQRAAVPQAHWHGDISALPVDRPLLIVANEFFDALPIRQFVRTASGWREHMVVPDAARGPDCHCLMPGAADCGDQIPLPLAQAPLGAIVERNPAGESLVTALSGRLATQGGALLAIDYGYEGPATGDTLQAMANHGFADPLQAPGTRDLTAHVDFAMLAAVAHGQGVRTTPCVPQSAFLTALGIEARATTLARANPAQAGAIAAAHHRLVAPEAMGSLFKVLALRHPDWPLPAGFA